MKRITLDNFKSYIVSREIVLHDSFIGQKYDGRIPFILPRKVHLPNNMRFLDRQSQRLITAMEVTANNPILEQKMLTCVVYRLLSNHDLITTMTNHEGVVPMYRVHKMREYLNNSRGLVQNYETPLSELMPTGFGGEYFMNTLNYIMRRVTSADLFNNSIHTVMNLIHDGNERMPFSNNFLFQLAQDFSYIPELEIKNFHFDTTEFLPFLNRVIEALGYTDYHKFVHNVLGWYKSLDINKDLTEYAVPLDVYHMLQGYIKFLNMNYTEGTFKKKIGRVHKHKRDKDNIIIPYTVTITRNYT